MPINVEMLADSNGTPQGPPADAVAGLPQPEQSEERKAIPDEIARSSTSPDQSGEIRYKRRKRHRRRHRSKVEKRFIWDLCLGGAVLVAIILLLIAISKSAPTPNPIPPIQELPTGR